LKFFCLIFNLVRVYLVVKSKKMIFSSQRARQQTKTIFHMNKTKNDELETQSLHGNNVWKNVAVTKRKEKKVLKIVMGLGQFFMARVRLVRFGSPHLWFEFGKLPLKMSNFSIFSLRVKKYPGHRRVGLLFTAGLKQPWAGSRPISSWKWSWVFYSQT